MKEHELLEYLIVNAVGKGIEQALEKHLKPLKEELAKVKALNAKILKEQAILKESYAYAPSVQQPAAPAFRPIGAPVQPTVINEAAKSQELNYLKSQAAPFVKADGHLPDVDIDPGLFLTKLR